MSWEQRICLWSAYHTGKNIQILHFRKLHIKNDKMPRKKGGENKKLSSTLWKNKAILIFATKEHVRDCKARNETKKNNLHML
jgi:hypothetical protein